MKDITPILRSLGLLDSEVKTYLASLKNGPSTVIELTKTTRLSRQAVYVAIESLSERSLMTNVTRGKKRYYAAEHPDKLLAYAQRRQNEMEENVADLKRTLPELELQVGGEKPVVKMYEGKEGIRASLNAIQIDRPKEIYEIGDSEAVRNILSDEDLKPLSQELKKVGTKTKGIYHSPHNKEDEKKPDRIYLDSTKGSFSSDIFLYKNKIVMMSFKGKLYSVIIESEPLADALKILFDLALKGK